MKEKSCEKLIDDKMKSRILEIARCLGGSEASEKRREDFEQHILSIDSVKVYTVLLSWGGPSDEFEVHVKDGEIVDIFYVYKDWFDGARRKLDGKAFDKVAQMFDHLAYEE